MVDRRRLYARIRRRVEDRLVDCLANPVAESLLDIDATDETFAELKELGVSVRTVIRKPFLSDPCIVLVESFDSVRQAAPDEIVVYVLPSVDEGELGIRDLFFSRLPEI